VERHVKERLVGAAVLMAAAVILIPEMLSGPRERATEPEGEKTTSFKTVTIDLNRSPGSQPVAEPTLVAETAPPPEEVAAHQEIPSAQPLVSQSTAAQNPPPAPQASPETKREEAVPQPAAVSRVAEAPSRPQSPSANQVKTPAAKQTSPAPKQNAPAAVASRTTVPTSSGWAVQLGSFSNRATADRLVKDFAGSGYTAFVMPVQSGGNTLYRVRVGPYAERAAANDALAAIKKRVANAAVVAHP
jgi:DedD protein